MSLFGKHMESWIHWYITLLICSTVFVSISVSLFVHWGLTDTMLGKSQFKALKIRHFHRSPCRFPRTAFRRSDKVRKISFSNDRRLKY